MAATASACAGALSRGPRSFRSDRQRMAGMPVPERPRAVLGWLTIRSCRGDVMTTTAKQVSQLLHEASETHHTVFRIVDGADEDWASWYAWWLINWSELPSLLAAKPVRSELIYLLVSLDKQYTA